MTSNKISVGYILEKIYRDLGINRELPYDDCVEWLSEALLKIGAYTQFEEKVCELEFTNSRAKVPCDLYRLKLVKYQDSIVPYSGNSFPSAYFCDDCKIPKTTDFITKTSFYINDSYIFLDLGDDTLNSGKICIEYISIPLDEDNLPLIPDDPSYTEACKAYITMKLDYIDWRGSRIPDKVFQHSEREWHFYCGQAKAAGNMPDLNQMERLKNIWVRLMPLQNEFRRGFSNLNNPERKYTK